MKLNTKVFFSVFDSSSDESTSLSDSSNDFSLCDSSDDFSLSDSDEVVSNSSSDELISLDSSSDESSIKSIYELVAPVPEVVQSLVGNPPKIAKACDISEQVVGTTIMKQFINPISGSPKMYTGIVGSYDSDYKWYKIYYEDGDEEEMSIEEVTFYGISEHNMSI